MTTTTTTAQAWQVWPGCDAFMPPAATTTTTTSTSTDDGDTMVAPAPTRSAPRVSTSSTDDAATMAARTAIWDMCTCVIFDCDGVIWRGNDPIKGGKELVGQLQEQGKRVFFCSNNSTKARDLYVTKLAGMGITAKKEDVICSAFAVAVYLASVGKDKFDKDTQKVLTMGGGGLMDELDEYGIQYVRCEDAVGSAHMDADALVAIPPPENIGAIVVASDMEFTYTKAAYMANALRWCPDALFVCSNQDPSYPAAPGVVLPGAGAAVNFMAAAAQRIATDVGKPSRVMWDIIRHRYKEADGATTMFVGDRMSTDVAFANNVGMRSVLVLSGVTSIEDARGNEEPRNTPTFVAPSVYHLCL